MNRPLLHLVAGIDAANVVALAIASPPHGRAAGLGYAPALLGVALVTARPRARRAARALAISGIVPNTVLAIRASDGSRRSRALSAYLALGGAIIGVGYLTALARD